MAQLVEHRVHIAGVTGSSPVATTTETLDFSRVCGGRNRTRTCDPIDVNDVLYQLSHATLFRTFLATLANRPEICLRLLVIGVNGLPALRHHLHSGFNGLYRLVLPTEPCDLAFVKL